jgi:hypothetical protein
LRTLLLYSGAGGRDENKLFDKFDNAAIIDVGMIRNQVFIDSNNEVGIACG